MFDVQTLFVISSRRGSYIIEDLLASLRWTARGTYKILVVDEVGGVPNDPELLKLPRSMPISVVSGFQRLDALARVLAEEAIFRQAFLLEDTCLVTGRGLDTWLASCFQDSRVGVLGVQDQGDFQPWYRQALPLLDRWDVPHARWENPPVPLSPQVIGMTMSLAQELRRRDLLTLPEACDWPLHYGAFVSWAAQMLGYLQVSWGYVTKPLPPLYVCDRGGGGPAPHILSERFALYAPANGALAYSEGDLREMYKQVRGEPARQLSPFGPVVSAPLS